LLLLKTARIVAIETELTLCLRRQLAEDPGLLSNPDRTICSSNRGRFMICPRCQSENPPNAAFCDRCGARLEKACPNCGEPNRHGAKFCRNCGQAIGQPETTAVPATAVVPAPETYVPKHLAEKILASRHKLEGERKQVTVLFADIRGSTKLLETLDPEDAQKIVDPVLHIMMDAVHKYEGTVNQVLGDGIMALFGAPLAHEDHALRACYSALAMQDEMQRYRQRLGQTEESGLHIGIGMNSGDVVVRSIDTDLNIDYSALGHTTHLAARMQELAGPGLALMSSTTLRQVEGFVQVQSLGPVHAKGISQPVEAYSLIGVTTARTRVQAGAARGLTPLVGRKAEIDIFNKLVQRVSDGRGQILAMIGEPGIGKSRLVHEFTRHQLSPGWLVIEGASASYGKATPYFPLIEMLRHYFGVGPEESSEDIRSRVVIHILELDKALKDAIAPTLSLLGALPDEKTTDEDHDWLAQMPDIPQMIRHFNSMDPQQRRRYTLNALKQLWIRESRRQNLLLVFEDLHWIDHETQAFLDSLVDSVPMARLLLLVNYRPGYNHEWSEKSYYTQLRVDPLQTSSAEELLSKLLGNNPDLAPLKQLLIQRTEGNPFFAEETVRSLAESGVLIGEKGAYRPALRVSDLVIPSTVQNVVADRLDRLPTEEKHLLQTAAVIGVIVPAQLLRAVTELPEIDLQTYLAHLQAGEFLYESNLFPELEYTFKHALTNEVAYGALLRERKILLHAKIVTAMETLFGSNLHDYLETIAQHAYRGELWEKAVTYSRQSGRKASQRSANQEAREFFQAGLRALENLPQNRANLQQAVDLRLELRNPLYFLSNFDELNRCLHEAESIAERIADDRRLGRVINFLNSYYGLMGEHHRSIEFGTRGLQINRDDKELNTVTHYYMGLAYHHVGQYARSIDSLRRTLPVTQEERLKYERFGTAHILSVICRVWLAQSYAQLGYFKDGKTFAEEAMMIAKEADHASSLAFAHIALGFVHLIQGNVESAIKTLQTSQKICDVNNIQVLMPHIASNLAYAYAIAGRVDDAIRLVETADEQSKLTGRKAAWALRLTWLGYASLIGRQIGKAREQSQRAVTLAGDAGERGYDAWARKLLGDISQEDSNPSEAFNHYAASMALATELAMRPLQAHIHLSLGRLHRRESQIEKARTELMQAVTAYRTMEMSTWTHVAEQELGTFLG
jgi:class 3 adenylate cyclase/tetratricopeptide (TPR) repeat protein